MFSLLVFRRTWPFSSFISMGVLHTADIDSELFFRCEFECSGCFNEKENEFHKILNINMYTQKMYAHTHTLTISVQLDNNLLKFYSNFNYN